MANKNTYNNTMDVFDDWGIIITEGIVKLLSKKRKNASHKLSNSVDYDVNIDEKEGIFFKVFYEEYGEYVLSGRKRGSKQPPIDKIVMWIRQKKIPVKTSVGKPTGKVKKLSKYGKEKSLAFAIAKNISKFGIKPFNFLLPYEKAIEGGKMMKDIRLALVQDGYASLQKPITQFNNAQNKKK